MEDGDWAFGTGLPFLIDSPLCVAQAIMTRIRLAAGEWFLDLNEGLAEDQILGAGTQNTRDLAIRVRILDTPGVEQISDYLSFVDPADRSFNVLATVVTTFGQTSVAVSV
jgi:hypothetical protein